MENLGVPASKLSVTGIPIDPVFREVKDKREMRLKHDLAPDLTTILVSAGGFGVGKVDELWTSLKALQHPAQVVALCGRNEDMQKRLERISTRQPANARVRLKSIGYTTEVDELMSASDILLGKPGGLTTSEGLAKGLVFVIVNPIPGQEERNADHLLEQGVAIRANNLPALAYKVDRLLDDTKRFEGMKSNALRMARPDAAFAIVNKLKQIVTEA
jgi:processive 1,2-diacylglycerol beta-glucosyltransferase